MNFYIDCIVHIRNARQLLWLHAKQYKMKIMLITGNLSKRCKRTFTVSLILANKMRLSPVRTLQPLVHSNLRLAKLVLILLILQLAVTLVNYFV